jgi:hypothetical protein
MIHVGMEKIKEPRTIVALWWSHEITDHYCWINWITKLWCTRDNKIMSLLMLRLIIFTKEDKMDYATDVGPMKWLREEPRATWETLDPYLWIC